MTSDRSMIEREAAGFAESSNRCRQARSVFVLAESIAKDGDDCFQRRHKAHQFALLPHPTLVSHDDYACRLEVGITN
ncbi:hypothetical protein ECG_02718 [Echinococcus granulosus]|uniref:Transposase n=1 Tax=Echinococcus granulosus TaxID=6210 RepID=A0A068WNK5_ECHGR|nr:hypothetical protein ECG_02718 [Echinococcus granulosus]CDS21713.1 hypothetical protein EgrG_000121100 [Echinococcus granulosus]